MNGLACVIIYLYLMDEQVFKFKNEAIKT